MVDLSAPCGRAALDLAALGLRVLPLVPCGKQPLTQLVPHGYHDATSDAATVADWWRQVPDANVGITCAPSGLLVTDVDPRHGGDDALHDLERLLGPLPDTIEALTGGGGRHLFYQLPEGTLRGQLAAGVDLKAHGYIVAPPSIHPNGRRYEWACDQSPWDLVPQRLPERWARAVIQPPAAERPRGDRGDDALREIPASVYVARLAGRHPSRTGQVRCPLHKGGEERHPSMRLYGTNWACWACPPPHGPLGAAGGSIYDFAARLWGYALPLSASAFVELRSRLLEELLGARRAA